MANGLKEAAAFILWVTGVPLLIREVVTRDRTGILLYHDPTPETFERHVAYLTQHYSLIPFDDLVDALERRDWSSIPPKSLVIHIDDGYARNYRLLDSLIRHRVRPTLYLCSRIAGSNRWFWSKLQSGRAKQLRLVENLRLLQKLQEEAAFTPDREYPERQALSRQEIAAMSAQIDFQAHGRYHFSLLTLDDDRLQEELLESKAEVEQLTNQPCDHFSFPYGDYGDREIEAVRRCGYRTARTTEPGWNDQSSNRHRLKILADVPGTVSVNVLRAHLSGIPRLLKRLAYRRVTRAFRSRRQEILMRRRFLHGVPER